MENLKISIRPARIEDGEIIGKFQIACAKETEQKDLHLRTVEAGVLRILSSMRSGPMGPLKLGEYLVVEK